MLEKTSGILKFVDVPGINQSVLDLVHVIRIALNQFFSLEKVVSLVHMVYSEHFEIQMDKS